MSRQAGQGIDIYLAGLTNVEESQQLNLASDLAYCQGLGIRVLNSAPNEDHVHYNPNLVTHVPYYYGGHLASLLPTLRSYKLERFFEDSTLGTFVLSDPNFHEAIGSLAFRFGDQNKIRGVRDNLKFGYTHIGRLRADRLPKLVNEIDTGELKDNPFKSSHVMFLKQCVSELYDKSVRVYITN
jgi:hypothetical protein